MLLQTNRPAIRLMKNSDWLSVMRIADDFSSGPYVYYDHPMLSNRAGIQRVVQFFADFSSVYSVLLADSSEMIGYVCLWPGEVSIALGCCSFEKEYLQASVCFPVKHPVQIFILHIHSSVHSCCFRTITDFPD